MKVFYLSVEYNIECFLNRQPRPRVESFGVVNFKLKESSCGLVI